MRVKFPIQIGQGEAINVEFALTLLRGQSLYHDPSQAPYLYSAYPPLYPWLQSLLLKFISNIWLPGRLLAFLGYAGCGFLIFFWGRRRWGWPLALLLASLFGLFPTWALWGTMDRCDAFYLLLHFSAFLLLYKESVGKEGDFRWGLIALAGILCALAILVKQSAADLLAVYGIYCLAGGRWKKIPIFLFFSLLPAAAVFYFVDLKSGGFFYKHVFLWLDTGINWENFKYYLLHSFLREGGMLVMICALLLSFKRLNGLIRWQILFSFFVAFSFGAGHERGKLFHGVPALRHFFNRGGASRGKSGGFEVIGELQDIISDDIDLFFTFGGSLRFFVAYEMA